MEVIKIDNVSYNVKSSWREITLGDYIYCASLEEKGFNKRIKILSHLSGISEEVFKDAEPSLFIKCESIIAFFYNTTYSEKLTNEFWHEGVKYCYDNNINKTCLAQYVDLLTVLEDNKDNMIKAYPHVLSILFLPEGQKYNSDASLSRIDTFLSIPIGTAHAVINFFFYKIKIYKRTQAFIKEADELSRKLKENLVKSGRGSGPSVSWRKLTAILLNRWRT